jgi:hypothetical protein
MFCSRLLAFLLLTVFCSANELQSNKRALTAVSQQSLPPVWVKPSWWPRYRKEFGKKTLKKCLFLNGQVPTSGSNCDPKDGDYLCLFGEQCCRLADGTVETHPQIGCGCKKDQPMWTCHDVNIVCEPCAKEITLQKDTTSPPNAAAMAPIHVDPLPSTTAPDAAAMAPMQVDPLPSTTAPDAAASVPIYIDPLPTTTPPDAASVAPMQVDPLPFTTAPDAAAMAPIQLAPLQVDPLPVTTNTTTIDVPTTVTTPSNPIGCPTDEPFGGDCQGDLECMYGTESCCGVTHASMRCVCRGGHWGCMYLDMCLSQTCS